MAPSRSDSPKNFRPWLVYKAESSCLSISAATKSSRETCQPCRRGKSGERHHRIFPGCRPPTRPRPRPEHKEVEVARLQETDEVLGRPLCRSQTPSQIWLSPVVHTRHAPSLGSHAQGRHRQAQQFGAEPSTLLTFCFAHLFLQKGQDFMDCSID